MNFITAYSALLIAGFSAMVSAKLGIEPMLDGYNSGDNTEIMLWTDSQYSVRAIQRRL